MTIRKRMQRNQKKRRMVTRKTMIKRRRREMMSYTKEAEANHVTAQMNTSH